MKTAISLPDRLYKLAEKTAHSLGIPRSQLFARALEEFIQRHGDEHVTGKLNEIYPSEDSHLDPVLNKMQNLSLKRGDKFESW